MILVLQCNIKLHYTLELYTAVCTYIKTLQCNILKCYGIIIASLHDILKSVCDIVSPCIVRILLYKWEVSLYSVTDVVVCVSIYIFLMKVRVQEVKLF